MSSIDISDILEHVGSFGRFQKSMFFLVCFPFVVNWNVSFWVHFFVLITPPHHCAFPGISDSNISKLLIPTDSTGKQDSCHRYDVNTSLLQQFDLKEAEVYFNDLQKNEQLNTIPCDNGWTFDTSEDITSAASDFLWVCENTWKKFATQTMFSIGSMVGMIIFGCISDAYGRLPCAIAACLVSPIANLALLLCSDFYVYCFLRFVMGLVEYSLFIMPFFILMEYLPPKARSLVNPIAFGVFTSFFHVANAWLYKLMGNWYIVLLYVSVFMLATSLPALHFVPESASWLLTQGRVDKCLSIIQKIAKTNGKDLSPNEVENIKSQMNTISKNMEALPKVSLNTALKCKTVCLQIMIGVMLSMIINLVNDGNTRNTETVEMSTYVMFTLFSVVMIPSQLLSGFLMTRFGRQATLVVGFGTCCIANVLIVLLPPELLTDTLRIVLMVTFRLFDVICFTSTITYLTEILPTVVRARGMAVINCAGALAMALGPQVIYLANFVPWLPSLIFAIVGLVGVVLTSILPETKDRPLVQTLEDVERRGFSRLCCSRAIDLEKENI